MDEIMSVLRKIQNDLNEQRTAILENGNIVAQQVTQNINTILEEKFKTWEEKFNNISEKIENQEKRLFFLEKQARQRNIVLFGFEETETSYSNLESNILNFVAQYFSIHMDRRDIQEIKRLGKKGEKPRPTIIMFSTLGLKIDIFQNRGKLKGTHYYIKEDYPKNILEKRKLLQNQVRMEREKGNNAIIKIDAAKHMWPEDLRIIYDRLHNLNIAHGFPPNARPYIYQEVIDYGGEAISRDEYTPIGAVTEFKTGLELSNSFRGNNALRWLLSWGPQWGLLASGDALTFIDNHDNERGHGGGGGILTYKEPKPYKGAIAFLLAHPYGEPQIMSSFQFWDSEIGPPMDNNQNIISPLINSDGSCGNGWVCQHRWRQIYAMIGFRNAAGNTDVTTWWDNGNNQIAFCRGNNAFIAFNNEYWDLNQNLQTCLPPGTYCDVISGDKVNNTCRGKSVTVASDGRAQISVGANEYDMMLAIHIGPESRL